MSENCRIYRHKIEFFKFIAALNEFGESEKEEIKICEAFAQIKPYQGNEKFFNDKVNTEISHRIKIRYQSGLDNEMIIKFGGRIFEIVSLINKDELNKEILIMAIEKRA